MKLTFNRIPLLKLAIMLIAVLIGIFGIGRFGSNVVESVWKIDRVKEMQ